MKICNQNEKIIIIGSKTTNYVHQLEITTSSSDDESTRSNNVDTILSSKSARNDSINWVVTSTSSGDDL